MMTDTKKNERGKRTESERNGVRWGVDNEKRRRGVVEVMVQEQREAEEKEKKGW